MIGPCLWLQPPRTVASVARLRREVAAWARTTGIGETTIDDLVLVLSELVTNAVRYGSGARVRVVVGRIAGLVDLRVFDDGPAATAVAGNGSGHGLAIVRALAEVFTLEHGPDGTAAHARLRVRTETASARSAATLPPVPGP